MVTYMHSIFELFKIGVGPSSSHTVGPMVAANRFAADLAADAALLERTQGVVVELFGSLALTGVGHGTDSAVIAGLSGLQPASVDPAEMAAVVAEVRESQMLTLETGKRLTFCEPRDLLFHKQETLPFHPNCAAVHGGGRPAETAAERPILLCRRRFCALSARSRCPGERRWRLDHLPVPLQQRRGVAGTVQPSSTDD